MKRRTTALGIGMMVMAAPALAVKTASWKHDQPKDFGEGTFEEAVVSSRGQLMLGRDVKVLHETKDDADVVNALARGPDGAIYAGTGGDGVVYRIVGEDANVFARLPDKHVFSLLFAKDGALLAGTGGEKGRIFRIDAEGKYQPFHEPEGVSYVWAMARGSEGEVLAATGTDGKLLRIEPDGKKSTVLLDAKQKNLLCLATDAGGMLYVGTDTDGLVFRVDPKEKKPYVLYDAEEPEISALVIDGEGNVYAATASASAAKPGRELGDKAGGKPDGPKAPATSTKPSASATKAVTLPDALAAMAARAAAGKSAPGGAAGGVGNAIYKIDRDGFVSEVFREPVMILALQEAGGKLYAATGNEGRIYEIVPAEQITTNIARLKGSQAVSLLRLEDGTLIAGTANESQVVRVSTGYAKKGTYLSAPLDAKQIVRFGRARWRIESPEGTKITLATRSGNVKDTDEPTWDAWSPETDATNGAQVASPSARFLQYRLTLETNDAAHTPRLDEIEIARLEDNRAPRVTDLRVGSAKRLAQDPNLPQLKTKLGSLGPMPMAQPGPSTHHMFAIAWSTEDPNGDSTVSDVFYRAAGKQRWVRLEKDFKEDLRLWNTTTVADGLYEVKVVAKDAPDNAADTALTDARISEPVLVDNTPPVIRVERLEPDGKKLHVRMVVKDALSPISAVHYTINSDDEWKATTPADDIFDSPEETIELTIEDLETGEQAVAIRAVDENGNAAYATQTATIGP